MKSVGPSLNKPELPQVKLNKKKKWPNWKVLQWKVFNLNPGLFCFYLSSTLSCLWALQSIVAFQLTLRCQFVYLNIWHTPKASAGIKTGESQQAVCRNKLITSRTNSFQVKLPTKSALLRGHIHYVLLSGSLLSIPAANLTCFRSTIFPAVPKERTPGAAARLEVSSWMSR